ncbi:MAG: hypothetical protein Q8P25_04160 [Candidatus Curtissbacteria bacterium]|nr:hypothetical protein [Candidatus Curtissbacteria bacterium]
MNPHGEKKIFGTIFIFLAFLMMLLPFMLAFEDVLTKLIERFVLYKFLQDMVVPVQVSLVSVIIKPFGVDSILYKNGMIVNGEPLIIAWNCLGWQSLVLFLITLLVGFRNGSYSAFSKFQVIILGLFGLFWINLLRISLIILLGAFFMPVFRLVFHEYLAAIVSIIFLLFFWWFSYKFVLETKEEKLNLIKE